MECTTHPSDILAFVPAGQIIENKRSHDHEMLHAVLDKERTTSNYCLRGVRTSDLYFYSFGLLLTTSNAVSDSEYLLLVANESAVACKLLIPSSAAGSEGQ